VRENLELFADLYGVRKEDRDTRLKRLMQFSRLEPFRDRMAGNLSGGMRQKLALSCALIHTPKLLFSTNRQRESIHCRGGISGGCCLISGRKA